MTSFELIFKVFLPISLLLIMFGMGLTLKLEDFRALLKQPKPALVGIIGQLILLPLLGFFLTSVLTLPPEIAVGIIILAACPGGVTSNAVVFIARGDKTLSVSLTAFNSIVSVFTIPLIIGYGLKFHEFSDKAVALDPLQTIMKLSILCIVPVVIGMSIGKVAPRFAAHSERFFKRFSAVVLLFLLAAVLFFQHDFLLKNFRETWLVAVLLNVFGMLLGGLLCMLTSINIKQTITLIIEIGMQNSNLAILIATTLLQNPALAVTPGVYGVLSLFTTGLFVIIVHRLLSKSENTAVNPH